MNPKAEIKKQEIKYFVEDLFDYIWSRQQFCKSEVHKKFADGFDLRFSREVESNLKHFTQDMGDAVRVSQFLLREYLMTFFNNSKGFHSEFSKRIFKREVKLIWLRWIKKRKNIFVKVLDTLAIIAEAFLFRDKNEAATIELNDANEWFIKWFEEHLAKDFFQSGGWKQLDKIGLEWYFHIYKTVNYSVEKQDLYKYESIGHDCNIINVLRDCPVFFPVPEAMVCYNCQYPDDGKLLRKIVFIRPKKDVTNPIEVSDNEKPNACLEIKSVPDKSQEMEQLELTTDLNVGKIAKPSMTLKNYSSSLEGNTKNKNSSVENVEKISDAGKKFNLPAGEIRDSEDKLKESTDGTIDAENKFNKPADGTENYENKFSEPSNGLEDSESNYNDPEDRMENSESNYNDPEDKLEDSESNYNDPEDGLEDSESKCSEPPDGLEDSESKCSEPADQSVESKIKLSDPSCETKDLENKTSKFEDKIKEIVGHVFSTQGESVKSISIPELPELEIDDTHILSKEVNLKTEASIETLNPENIPKSDELIPFWSKDVTDFAALCNINAMNQVLLEIYLGDNYAQSLALPTEYFFIAEEYSDSVVYMIHDRSGAPLEELTAEKIILFPHLSVLNETSFDCQDCDFYFYGIGGRTPSNSGQVKGKHSKSSKKSGSKNRKDKAKGKR